MIEIIRIEAFQDNYIWLLRDENSSVVVVDPGDASPVLSYLLQHKLKLSAILITHHHHDHCGGVKELLSQFNVPVYGGAHEPIPHLTHPLKEGDLLDLGMTNAEHPAGFSFKILEIPGHTLGHIAYVGGGMLFCGDTLFTAGCGRIFEGTADQMLHSLNKLKSLPHNTQVYCGHEYTVANLQFALQVEPENEDIKSRLNESIIKRQKGLATVPATLAIELKTNPFLRSDLLDVKEAASVHANRRLITETEVFAEIRHWKNNFHIIGKFSKI